MSDEEQDLERRIGEALRVRADGFEPDVDRALRRLELGGRRPTGRLALASVAAASLALIGASWWALSDGPETLDVSTPDPTHTSTTTSDAGETTPPEAPALAVLPRWSPEMRGRVALLQEGQPVELDLDAYGPVALSPDGSSIAFTRSTGNRDEPAKTVVHRLADGKEETVPGAGCLSYSPEGRLVTVSRMGGAASETTILDVDLEPLAGLTTSSASCPGWDVGGERVVAIGRDDEHGLLAWTLTVDGESRGRRLEGLHPETHVMLGPAFEPGRFLVIVSSQHPPFSIGAERWELGELSVGVDGHARYESVTELAAVPDWTNPDRVLTSPTAPIPLGPVRPEVRDDGTLVFEHSPAPWFLVTDGVNGNVFAVDLDGQVRYLMTGVWSISPGPLGIGDDHLGVPLTPPEWIERVPPLSPNPCEAPASFEADFNGGAVPDRAFHQFLGGTDAVLGVCLGDGRVDSVAGRGQTEIGGFIDLGPDGPVVLTAGGTSVSWGGFDVAVVIEGRIRWVELDGEQLRFWDGHQGLGDDGLAQRGGAYGCEDVTGDGVLELVQVEVDLTDDETLAAWEKRAYRIEGASASLVATERGTTERTEFLLDAAAPLVQPCESIE